MTSEQVAGQIIGIKIAAEVMRANAGDEFDRAFCGRVVTELNRRIVDLQKQQAAAPPAPWVPQPPQPCPLGETAGMPCFRRDGETAVIDAGRQGKVCVGCEWKVSTLEGGRP
jgi:hypothetical protein